MAETVVVTGASRGIGRHCAERLHEAGYRVVGMARQPDEDAPFEIVACDVADPASVKRAFAPLRRDAGFCALINAAGVASMNLLLTTPPDTIRRIVDTNLCGTIFCCQAAAPALIRHGTGRIVNFSTIAVPLGLEGEAVYVASKAGVEAFSRAFAREMAGHGCTVNVIAPGPVETDLIAKVPAEKIDAIVERQIIDGRARPDDVYAVVRLLLSADSASLTGEVFHIKGV